MISKLKSILDPKRLSIVVPSVVFLSLLAANVKPFGVEALSFTKRFLFWLVVMCVAAVIVQVSIRLVSTMTSGTRTVLREIAVAILVTVLFTPSLWLLIWIASAPGEGMLPDGWTMVQYGLIFATGLIVVRRSFPWSFETVTEVTPEPVLPRLYKRLPEGFDGKILRLTVRDHSVDIITTSGLHTIRSRFADAIDEMEPVKGHCTHRSHWVCEEAIESVERQAGKIFIRLVNGDLVPVSRKYKPRLEEAGIV